MTVATVLTALSVRFLAINPTPEPVIARVHVSLREAVELADFPCAVLTRAGGSADHELLQEAVGTPGLGAEYWLCKWFILIAGNQVPTPEAKDRLHPYPRALMVALLADLTLSGAVAFIGHRDSNLLTTYQEGLIPWLTPNTAYWGLTGLLPIMELVSTNVG